MSESIDNLSNRDSEHAARFTEHVAVTPDEARNTVAATPCHNAQSTRIGIPFEHHRRHFLLPQMANHPTGLEPFVGRASKPVLHVSLAPGNRRGSE